MKGQIPAVVAATTLGMLFASGASADDKDEQSDKNRDDTVQKSCVDLARLRNTTVIDDHTILFTLRNGDILLNYLPQACPDLAREKRFSYRVTANRLCDVDTITVLQDFGLGLGPGATCRLGSFNPITKEAAADLKAGPRKPLIRAEQVEPIETDNKNGDAQSGGANGESSNSETSKGQSSNGGSANRAATGSDEADEADASSSDDDKGSSRESRREKRRRAREQDRRD
jgi:hypothetical protein